jgi:hypothetical protein
MHRAARIIGAAGALAVAAFALLLVALLAPATRPGSVVIGIAYLAAAAIILLAPRASAGFAAIATAVLTAILALVAMGNEVLDGLILLGAAGALAWAGWALMKQPEPKAPSDSENKG